jgi:hypothetical protein
MNGLSQERSRQAGGFTEIGAGFGLQVSGNARQMLIEAP